METISSARRRASSRFCIKAPFPSLTSEDDSLSTGGNFLHITDEAINGMDCTVPLTSRRP